MAYVSKTSRFVCDPERDFKLELNSFNGKASHDSFWDLFWRYRFIVRPELSHFKTAFGNEEGTTYYRLTVSVITLLQDALIEYGSYKSPSDLRISEIEDKLFEIEGDEECDDVANQLEEELEALEELSANDEHRIELDNKCRERFDKVLRHFNVLELYNSISVDDISLSRGCALSRKVAIVENENGEPTMSKVRNDSFDFIIEMIAQEDYYQNYYADNPIVYASYDPNEFPNKAYSEPPINKDDLLIFYNSAESQLDASMNLRTYIKEALVNKRPDILEYIFDLTATPASENVPHIDMMNLDYDRMYRPRMYCVVLEEDFKKWKDGKLFFCAALNYRKKLSPLATKEEILSAFKDEIDYDLDSFGGWWTAKYNYGIYTFAEFYNVPNLALHNASVIKEKQTLPDGTCVRVIGWTAPEEFEDYYKDMYDPDDE